MCERERDRRMFTPEELGMGLLLLVAWIGWEVGNDKIDSVSDVSKERKVREKRSGQGSYPDVILWKERLIHDRGMAVPVNGGDPSEHEAQLDMKLEETKDRTLLRKGMSNDGFLERDAEPGSSRDVAGRMRELYYISHLRSVALREPPHRNDNGAM